MVSASLILLLPPFSLINKLLLRAKIEVEPREDACPLEGFLLLRRERRQVKHRGCGLTRRHAIDSSSLSSRSATAAADSGERRLEVAARNHAVR